MTFSYKSLLIPEGYKCGRCGSSGCKLWRGSYEFSPELRCIACATKETHTAIYAISKEGKHFDIDLNIDTDQIGKYVPAVPLEGEPGYWGYTSVPPDGINWWVMLPLFDEGD